ncbi:MAG: hypothetical protein WCP53_14060, partial [Verrucomicrobiota bacterium]
MDQDRLSLDLWNRDVAAAEGGQRQPGEDESERREVGAHGDVPEGEVPSRRWSQTESGRRRAKTAGKSLLAARVSSMEVAAGEAGGSRALGDRQKLG